MVCCLGMRERSASVVLVLFGLLSRRVQSAWLCKGDGMFNHPECEEWLRSAPANTPRDDLCEGKATEWNQWGWVHCPKMCCELTDFRSWTSGTQHEVAQAVQRCAPSSLVLTEQVVRKPAPCTPFYLNEGGDFNMSAVESCFDNYTSVQGGNYDNVIHPERAQHLADLHLLRQLRAHPARTMDESVGLHFTGLLPTVSWIVDYFGFECSELVDRHQDRMTRAATAMQQRLNNNSASGIQRLYVLVSSHWGLDRVFGPLYSMMTTALGRKHLILAGSDLAFATPATPGMTEAERNRNLKPNFVTIPYVSTYYLEDEHWAGSCKHSDRPYSFVFAGSMGRSGAGSNRYSVMRVMEIGSSQSLIIDAHFGYEQKQTNTTLMAMTYAEHLRRSRFCLVPAGDTATSRRLYDALAAGCMPVYMGAYDTLPIFSGSHADPLSCIAGVDPFSQQSDLPFRSVLNWSSLILFAGQLHCLASNHLSGARALADHLMILDKQTSSSEFEQGCHRRQAEYKRAMSYFAMGEGRGAASALLTELYEFRKPSLVDERLNRWCAMRKPPAAPPPPPPSPSPPPPSPPSSPLPSSPSPPMPSPSPPLPSPSRSPAARAAVSWRPPHAPTLVPLPPLTYSHMMPTAAFEEEELEVDASISLTVGVVSFALFISLAALCQHKDYVAKRLQDAHTTLTQRLQDCCVCTARWLQAVPFICRVAANKLGQYMPASMPAGAVGPSTARRDSPRNRIEIRRKCRSDETSSNITLPPISASVRTARYTHL